PWLGGAPRAFVGANGTRPLIAEPASVDGVYAYQQLAATYADPAVMQKNTNDVEALFAAGRFAVTFGSPSLAQALQAPKSQGGYADDVTARAGFGTQPFPAGPKAHAVFFGGSNLAVLKSSRQQAAAYEWVRWLTSDQGQASYVAKVGAYPARVSAGSAGVFTSSPYLPAFKSQLQYGRAYPITPAWGTIETSTAPALANVCDV